MRYLVQGVVMAVRVVMSRQQSGSIKRSCYPSVCLSVCPTPRTQNQSVLELWLLQHTNRKPHANSRTHRGYEAWRNGHRKWRADHLFSFLIVVPDATVHPLRAMIVPVITPL